MSTETNQEAVVAPEDATGEAGATNQVETVAVNKAEYDKLNQELGSLKRDLKDLKKAKEEAREPSPKEPDAPDLSQKAFLRAAGLTDAEEVDLALATAKKWGLAVDVLVDDADWKDKLEKHRTTKANETATSDVKGSGNTQQASQTPEYWIAKGTAPTAEQIPDRKTRAKIARAIMASAKNSKTFYSE